MRVRPIDESGLQAHFGFMENDRSLAHVLRRYAIAVLLVGVSTIVGLIMAPRWGTSAVDLIFLPAVLAVAVFAGLGPAICAAVLAALAYNFFFTAPFHTFFIHHPADVVTVIVLLAAALVTSHLAASIRDQARLAQAHATRHETIAGFAHRLLGSASTQDIANSATAEIARLFECNAVLLIPRGELQPVAAYPVSLSLTPSDRAVAALVLASGEATGRGIAPAMAVEWQFYPVRSAEGTIAVMGVARDDGLPAVARDRHSLMQSLLDQVSLAIERARLEEDARGFAAVRERDRLRSALLSSIGQDLTPSLDTMTRTANDLRRAGAGDKAQLAALVAEAGKLQRYLANLVDLTPGDDQAPVEAHGVRIDLFNRTVSRDGEPVHLTPKEYAVLAELAKHPGRVLGHAQLLRAAWGPAYEKQSEYLRVAVRGLRQKLEADPKTPRLILNEPSVGYRLALNP
jgi:two-component system sensor histidine kinase KdpD